MEKLLSDAQIKAQYKDFSVNHISAERLKHSDGWSGTIELEFPNANHPDFDSSVIDVFIAYDEELRKIAFDRWYPEEIYDSICEQIRDYVNRELKVR